MRFERMRISVCRAALLASAVAVLLTGFAAAASSPVYAAPSPSPSTSPSPKTSPTPKLTTKQKIANLQDEVEQTAEQYNAAQVKLDADQKLAAQIEAQLGPMELQASVAGESLSSIAAQLYMAGPPHAYEILLNSSTSDAMIEQLSIFTELAHSQKAAIDSASEQITAFQAAQKEQNQLVTKDKALVSTLNSKKATINKQLASLQKLERGTSAPSKTYTKAQLMPAACPAAGGNGAGLTAAKKACSIIWQASKSPPWTMYLWGAPNSSNPHRYDCSGLTMTAWAAAGVTLAHFTGDQWTESHGKKWTSTSMSQLKIGDLIFYYSDHHHVAIYVGGGYIAQAPHTGAPLDMSTIGSPSGWGRPS